MGLVDRDYPAAGAVPAVESNLGAFYRMWGAAPGCEMWQEDGAACVITGIPAAAFNGLSETRLMAGEEEACIDRILLRFRDRGLPMTWWTGPSTRPVDLPERLRSRGLEQAESGDLGAGAIGMAIDLNKVNEALPRPARLHIQRVSESAGLEPYAATLIRASGMCETLVSPVLDLEVRIGVSERLPYQRYVAWLDGKPIATSALFIAGEVAGIYCVATIPEARRQGIGAAVTLAPVLAARDQGCRTGILQASGMGAGVYRRLGFRDACAMGVHIFNCHEQDGRPVI